MGLNNSLAGHSDLLDIVLLELPDKGVQYRLSITEFYGVTYISVREWYASFDGGFAPTSNGFNMPYNLHSSSALFHTLKSLLSKAETLSVVEEDTGFMSALLKKAELVDTMSLVSTIPAEVLVTAISSTKLVIDAELGKTFIVSEINLPEGSTWLL